MSDILLKIFKMNIQASIIILVVLVLRLLLKKSPKWITVLLWAIVAVRLIFPFSFESKISLMPKANTISNEIINVSNTSQKSEAISDNNDTSTDNDSLVGNINTDPSIITDTQNKTILILDIVWISGASVILLYAAVSYLHLYKRLNKAVLLKENIYQCEAVKSPFVLGFIKPKIYLPFNISEQNSEYVIAHEKAHIKRLDYIIKPLGFLILSINWFNPLVWVSFIVFCKDIELACDEKVIKNYNSIQRADYSQALLNCSINQHAVVICPIAFGEVGVKVRIKSVLNYKNPALFTVIIAVIAIIATSACFLTDPISRVSAQSQNANLVTQGKSLTNALFGTDDITLITNFEIIHKYGGVSTDITDGDDLMFLKEYKYSHKYPQNEIHKLFTFPETQMIKVISDIKDPQTLYLMQDGSIAIQSVNNSGITENSYDVYIADSEYALDEKALIELIKKYGGYIIN